ncbi:hypothetical protein EF908_31645 [Streptomyces sp. WAC04770]|nr:hypothetical protein EF908_31645 [Streptomyces sp. WAC04770]
MGGADPTVIKVGSLYVSAKAVDGGIAVRTASTAEGVATAPKHQVWRDTGNLGEVWAPEIVHHAGQYRIYFAAGRGAAHRMYHIGSATPTSGYSAAVKVSLPGDKWAIDGVPFTYNGQRWFVWSGWSGDTNVEQNLYIARMSSPTAATGGRYVISQPREPWERVVGNPYINEAPQPVVDPQGRLHVVYSANGSWSSKYCIADLRLRAGGDPTYVWDWYKSNGCLFGSHTACLHQPYADGEGTGTAHLDAARIAAHVTACTEAGLQAGFHAIGDAAVTAVVEGVRAAAETLGPARIRSARHRVEHAEMLTPETIAAFAELGLTASVQPAFDAAWGGPEGMYAQRLGAERAATLNPYAALLRAGVPLAFGSDSPVTPLDPWGTVRAAAHHRTPEHRISVRAGFTAHTRGGWRAVGRDDAGILVPGAPADYAVWRTAELLVQAPDDRVARWSTDPRSGTPGLPDLTPGAELPVCLRTVVSGQTVYVRPNE